MAEDIDRLVEIIADRVKARLNGGGIAPAALSRCAMNASRTANDLASASDPAVVLIRSAVSTTSLRRTGTP